MPRRKLQKYEGFSRHRLCIDKDQQENINWENEFGNNREIILEIGCGYGEYSLNLALNNQENNFVGIDIKGDRLFTAATQADNLKLNNIRFVRQNAELLENVFKPNSIAEIWITFPDPLPKKPRRRLVNSKFLKIYKNILNPNGKLKLLTDNLELFEYALTELENFGYNKLNTTYNVYNSGLISQSEEVKSRYQKTFYWRSVKYLEASF